MCNNFDENLLNNLENFVGDTATDTTGDCVTSIKDVQMNRVPIIEIIRNMVDNC